MADVILVRDWLKMIGAFNIGAMKAHEFETRLAILAPTLAADFPDAAFTPASAKHVAQQCKYFPVYGEVFPLLEAWQRERKLTFGMLLSDHSAYEPPPASQELPQRTEEELNHVTRLANEVVAALRHSDVEKEAYYAAQQPAWRRPAAQMTRAQLNEAYKRAGIQGPQLPKPGLRVVS